jgi:hypothetical protein
MRLEGWPRATAVQAAILRDASRRPKGEGLLLRMRPESLETIVFMDSIRKCMIRNGVNRFPEAASHTHHAPARLWIVAGLV